MLVGMVIDIERVNLTKDKSKIPVFGLHAVCSLLWMAYSMWGLGCVWLLNVYNRESQDYSSFTLHEHFVFMIIIECLLLPTDTWSATTQAALCVFLLWATRVSCLLGSVHISSQTLFGYFRCFCCEWKFRNVWREEMFRLTMNTVSPIKTFPQLKDNFLI